MLSVSELATECPAIGLFAAQGYMDLVSQTADRAKAALNTGQKVSNTLYRTTIGGAWRDGWLLIVLMPTDEVLLFLFFAFSITAVTASSGNTPADV